MTSPTPLSVRDAQKWQIANHKCDQVDKYTRIHVVTAVCLIVIPILVIYCSALCLTLPGVNAVTDVLRPAIVPSVLCLWLSWPFVYYAVKYSRQSKRASLERLNEAKRIAEDYDLRSYKDDRVSAKFIVKHLLNPLNFKTTEQAFLKSWKKDCKEAKDAEMESILDDVEAEFARPKEEKLKNTN